MRLPHVLTDQQGLFSRQQALESFSSQGSLQRALESGELTALATGVYVPSTSLDGVNRRERHLLQARAQLLSLGDAWALSHRTAAVVHGLPLLGYAPLAVQLTRSRTTRTVRSKTRHHRINALAPEERVLVDDMACTSLARTVFDLARSESQRSAVVVADAALRSGLLLEGLREVCAKHRGWPGSARARTAITLADGRAESPLESLGRLTCHEQELPLFEPQVEVWLDGEFVARVDGLWREALVVFEGDGAMKFDGEGVLPALLVRQERIREAGLPVVRASWADVTTRRRRWADRARQELRERGAPRLRPGVELRSTQVRPTPLDQSDHYRWHPFVPAGLSPQITALRAA